MVYIITPDSDTFDSLIPADSNNWELFDKFQGDRLADSWKPVSVKIIEAKKAADFPSLANHVPVFSVRAWNLLKPLIGDVVEALPLKCTKREYYAINVLNLLDILDQSRSEITWLPSGGIMFIDKYVFKKGCILDQPIFKLKEIPLKKPFVSNEFKNLVIKQNLEGLIFEKII